MAEGRSPRPLRPDPSPSPQPARRTSERPPSALLLALESRALFEWGAYAMSWPLLRKAPPGDGHPVLVLPGLIANDSTTWPLRRLLQELGYDVQPWAQGFNVGPKEHIVRNLVDRVTALSDEHQRKVSLVGWSLGGSMARALATQMPERIRSVITLGSPHGGDPRHTNAWRVFEMVSGMKADDPALHAQLSSPPPVPMTSILSKTDGVVAWQMSLTPEHPLYESIELSASHLGMGANPAVLWLVADRLSQPEDGWQRFDRNGWRGVFFRDPHERRLADLIAP
ncbi:MAG: alpha/beta fold hydrolase [Xanthomonadales bacterium]|nr:alpha/beta fold hydrolase [Xanthomonadales bacterium]